MTFSKDMPKSGQFVQVWEHEGKMWSTTLKWVKGVLYSYNEMSGSFDFAPGFDDEPDDLEYMYIISL